MGETNEPKRLGWAERGRHIGGGQEILSGRVRRALERQLGPDDRVLFCLKGDFEHSLIALEDRLMIIKAGMWAGTTFGARTTTIHYRDVTGIEVNTGLVNCVVEVSTASYPALGKKSVWFGGRTSKSDAFNRDPFTENNTIPVVRPNLKKWQPYLEQLRGLIAEAKDSSARAASTTRAEGRSLASELKELAELHQTGVLDDEEFAQAKARLLQERPT